MRNLLVVLFLILFAPSAFGAASTSYNGTSSTLSYSFVPVSGSGARSICLWMKSSSTNREILGTWGTSAAGAAGERWELRIEETNNSLRAEVNSGFEFANSDVTDGTWKFVCQVLTGTNVTDTVHYINNTDDGTSSSSSRALNTNTTCNLNISGRGGTSCTIDQSWYSGLMAHYYIYSKSLNSVEMAEIRFKGEMIPGSLLLYDPMFDGSSNHRELSSNARTGTAGTLSDSNDGPPVMFGGGLPL